MTNVVEFNFENNAVRTVEREDGVWFVAKDVSDVLGYQDSAQAVKSHCKNAIKMATVEITGSSDYAACRASGYSHNEAVRQHNVIPERDVYRLIMRSTLPAAEKFEDWVVGTVLPSIRKNGGYIQGQETAQSPEEVIANALIVAQRVIDNMKPKALYHDEWMSADGSYTITEVAKKLGITAQKLNKFLRDQHVKCKNSDMPRSGYESWFKIVDYAIEKEESKSIKSHVRVNGEGVKNIIQLYGETA